MPPNLTSTSEAAWKTSLLPKALPQLRKPDLSHPTTYDAVTEAMMLDQLQSFHITHPEPSSQVSGACLLRVVVRSHTSDLVA